MNPVNINDWCLPAKAYLPQILFDYIDGGVENEAGIAINQGNLNEIKLMPSYLVDVSDVNLQTGLFGKPTHMLSVLVLPALYCLSAGLVSSTAFNEGRC